MKLNYYRRDFNVIIISILFCVFSINNLYGKNLIVGKDLIVRNFKSHPSDNAAINAQTMRKDKTDKTTAILKIHTSLNENQTFFDILDSNNNVIEIVHRINNPGEIWLYLPANTESIIISNKNYNKLKYFFEEVIQAGKTYSMHLTVEGKVVSIVTNVGIAPIFIDGDSVGVSPLDIYIGYGEHEIRIHKGLMLYHDTINITKNSFKQIELNMQEIPISNVNDYIASYLPDFTTYVKDKTDYIEMPTIEDIRKAIEADITIWQTKGEFESTSDWNQRVTDKTRQERIDRLLKEWKEKSENAKALNDKKVREAKSEYQRIRSHYAEKYYAIKKKEELKKCSESIVSLNSPYDADNQVFLINSSIYGDILLPVPIGEAPAFKNNWEQISKSIVYDFLPADESNVALSKIVFTNNGKKYVYDGKSDATYAIADVNYNFNPIEIEDIDFDVNSLPVLSESTSVQTLNTAGISAKKVEVKRNSINASSSDGIKKGFSNQADIDKNIPKGQFERNNTFALVIANENYKRVSEVPYALNDGAIIKEYFNKTLGLPEKNILFAQDASLNDIRYNIKRLQDICGVFKGDASVIVYYAGHGVPDGKSLDAYLLPIDGYADDPGTGMALSELTETLAALPSKQTTLFIDACFSGTGREGAMLSEARGVKLRPKETNVSGNLIVFSASQGVETAHPLEEQGHGIFTYYLLKKLNESQGKIKLGELADFIINNVSRASVLDGNMQTPTVKTSLQGWENLDL